MWWNVLRMLVMRHEVTVDIVMFPVHVQMFYILTTAEGDSFQMNRPNLAYFGPCTVGDLSLSVTTIHSAPLPCNKQ